MREVEMRNVVTGAVVVGMQSEARYGLGDNSFQSQRIIVRAGEEVLFRMRIGNQLGAMGGQLWSKVRTLPATEPQFTGLDLRVGTANHLELKVGGDIQQRNWRPLPEIDRSITTASLFTSKKGK